MKKHQTPSFEFIQQNESNTKFFVASEGPASAGAALGSMTVTGPTAW